MEQALQHSKSNTAHQEVGCPAGVVLKSVSTLYQLLLAKNKVLFTVIVR